MPKKESLQHTLDRVRAPRVHLTYDVEIGDAIEMKEIPFVVGVLGDLSGKPDEPLPRLKDRKFIEIDRDNFNKVLEGMKPRLAFRVDNKLTEEDTKLAVELRFKSMDDFHPERVADQIEPSAQDGGGQAEAVRPSEQAGRQRQARRTAPGRNCQHRVPAAGWQRSRCGKS